MRGYFLDNIYLFKVNSRKTRKRFEKCAKLTINTPELASQFLTIFLSWLFEFQCCPNLLQENFVRNIEQIYHIRVYPRNNSVKITEKKQFSQVPYWRKPLMWMQLFQNKTSKFQWTLDDIKIEKKFEKITKKTNFGPNFMACLTQICSPRFFLPNFSSASS